MPEFNFSLPRLFARCTGQVAQPTEQNWIEANAVGALVHLVVYLYAFELLLARSKIWQQLLLVIPLAFAIWLFWLLVLYLNSLIIKALRTAGLMRALEDSRAQSFLICSMTTVFAGQLALTQSWTRFLGVFWITIVALNLVAALLLLFINGAHVATE